MGAAFGCWVGGLGGRWGSVVKVRLGRLPGGGVGPGPGQGPWDGKKWVTDVQEVKWAAVGTAVQEVRSGLKSLPRTRIPAVSVGDVFGSLGFFLCSSVSFLVSPDCNMLP